MQTSVALGQIHISSVVRKYVLYSRTPKLQLGISKYDSQDNISKNL